MLMLIAIVTELFPRGIHINCEISHANDLGIITVRQMVVLIKLNIKLSNYVNWKVDMIPSEWPQENA